MTIDETIKTEQKIHEFSDYQNYHLQIADWLEELKAKQKMLNFLFEVINPNDIEDYMRIYNSTDVKVEGENDDNR